MNNKILLTIVLVVSFLFGYLVGCIVPEMYWYGCAYCKELNSGFIAEPFCWHNEEIVRSWVDTVVAQSARAGQNLQCTIIVK